MSTSVGQVVGHTVTSREVEINFLAEQSLYPSRRGRVKKMPKIKTREFTREVTAVLLEWVVYLEAKSFGASRVSPSELKQMESNLKIRLKSSGSWKRLGVSSKELQSMLKRKKIAKRFIQFKADSSVVPITDGEATRYFEENRVKFGNLPFENFKDKIKAFLGRQQVDQRLKDWFEVLQSKYKVRNYLAEL